eukprot:gene13672-15100_t
MAIKREKVEAKKSKPQDPRKPRGSARKAGETGVKPNNGSAFQIIEQSLRSLHDVSVDPKEEIPKVDSKAESTKCQKELVQKDVSVKRPLPIDLAELMGCDETINATSSILDIDDDSSILNEILNIDFVNEFDKKKPVAKIAHKGQSSAAKQSQTAAVGKGRGKSHSFGDLIQKFSLSDSSSDEE